MNSPTANVKEPDVVCLHGSAMSGNQWRELMEKLGRRYRVVTPDLIGYGGQRFDARARLRLDDEVGAEVPEATAGARVAAGRSRRGDVSLDMYFTAQDATIWPEAAVDRHLH